MVKVPLKGQPVTETLRQSLRAEEGGEVIEAGEVVPEQDQVVARTPGESSLRCVFGLFRFLSLIEDQIYSPLIRKKRERSSIRSLENFLAGS